VPGAGLDGVIDLGAPVGLAADQSVVPAADVIRQRQLRRRLEYLVRVGTNRPDAEPALLGLRQRMKDLEDVYLCRIGTEIADSTDDCLQRIDDCLRKIRELGRRIRPTESEVRADLPTQRLDTRAEHRGLVVGAVVVMGLAAMTALWRTHQLSGRAAGIGAAAVLLLGVLLAWLLGRRRPKPVPAVTAGPFVPRDDAMYHAVRELIAATHDLERLLLLYQQYLAWAKTFGAFLAHPYGRQRGAARERGRLLGPLPRSIRVARLEPDERQIQEACRYLHGHLHGVGWLEPLWQDAMTSGLYEVARVLKTVQLEPDEVWADDAAGAHSALAELARRWQADGVDPASGDAAWRQAVALLGDATESSGARPGNPGGRPRGWGELGTVQELGHLDAPAVSSDGAANFIDTLRVRATKAHYFDRSVLTGPAVAAGLDVVDRQVAMPRSSLPAQGTLDRVQLVVQLSTPVPANLICLRDRYGRQAPPIDLTDTPVEVPPDQAADI
jgi:hypothetical protein